MYLSKSFLLTIIILNWKFSSVGKNINENLSDSISIQFSQKPEKMQFTYYDIFDNQSIYENNEKQKIPFIMEDIVFNHQIKYLIFQPAEKLSIKKNNDNFWYIYSNNNKSNSELNFDINFRKNVFPIKSPNDWFLYSRFLKSSFIKNYKLRENEIENYYNKKLNFLDKYSKINDLSREFKKNWTTLITYEKLRSQLSISSKPEIWPINYITTLFEDSKKLLNNDSLLFLREFRHSCQMTIPILEFIKFGKLSNSLTKNIEIVNENYNGKIKDYLIFSLLLNTKNGENNIKYEKNEFASQYNRFVITSKSEIYKNYLLKSLSLENRFINNDEVFNKAKIPVKLNEIINNKITYIDFWASWCAPCRAEMPDSKVLNEEYEKKGINFVYISTDKNPASWEKAMHQIGLSDKESFILPNGNESHLAKQFKIETIPRYILIGKDGKTINPNAPRPSDPKIKKIFDELLKTK